MTQPGILGVPTRNRSQPHNLHRIFQVGLLCTLASLGSRTVAHAANCVYTSSRLVSSTIAADGVLLIKTHCSGEGPDCRKAPALEVKRGDTRVEGSIEIIHQTRTDLWSVFRPKAAWQLGEHTVENLPLSWEALTATFEVQSAPSSFVFDAAAVNLSLASGLEPAGERICCPSHGEGSCDLDCGGADGERQVAVVSAALPRAPESVVWRIVDRDAREGTAAVNGSIHFADARERYCVKVSAWDTYDDTTHSFERCLDAADAALGEVGRVDATWSAMQLELCSAPPIPGGYGFDVWGEPDADALPEVDEPLRKAFCAAQQQSCGLPSQYAPDAGFSSRCSYSAAECPCIFVLHYCPEFASPDAGLPTLNPGEDEDTDQPARSDASTDSDDPEVGRTPRTKAKDGCALAHGRAHTSALLWAVLALVWSVRRRQA